MRRAGLILLYLMIAAYAAQPALCATAKASFSVSVTVVSTCQAAVAPASGPSDSAAVAVNCNLPTTYAVATRPSSKSARLLSGSGRPILNRSQRPAAALEDWNAMPVGSQAEVHMFTIYY